MKEINQTFACYICGKASAHARPWAMITTDSDIFSVHSGISVGCNRHDRESVADSIIKVAIDNGHVLTYFAVAERYPIEEAFSKATSLMEEQAALYAEDE